MTCDHPNGFTTANLGLVFECVQVIGRFYEVFTQRENARSLLETYVGKRTGARVLGGEFRRGDGDDIDAAIMFCDLRESTLLEERLGRTKYIDLLNEFFEVTSDIVHENGGEVLKFIGDAVLAVFPGDEVAASANALKSSKEIANRLGGTGPDPCGHPCDCSIGIDFGQVTYGNVGSRERLDFTVIGRAANVAARLGDYGKSIGHRIVVSRKVAGPDAHNASDMIDLGPVTLHNVSCPVDSFAVLASV
jgi:adenylate cyclase